MIILNARLSYQYGVNIVINNSRGKRALQYRSYITIFWDILAQYFWKHDKVHFYDIEYKAMQTIIATGLVKLLRRSLVLSSTIRQLRARRSLALFNDVQLRPRVRF